MVTRHSFLSEYVLRFSGYIMERERPYPITPHNTTLSGEKTNAHPDYEPRSLRYAKSLGAAAFYSALYAISVVGADISQGIQEGKERVAHDHAKIHSVYAYEADRPSFDTHATVVLTGLGTKDATETARSLTAHRDVGSVYAIEYGNKDLNTKDIADRIIEELREDDITRVSFDGYSMGGPIALDIATHLHSQAGDLEVVSIILNSSPVGEDSLTEKSRQSIQALEQVLSLHGDLVYYDNGRTLIELVGRSEHYLKEVGRDNSEGFKMLGLDEYSYDGVRYSIDYSALRHELSEIQKKMAEPKVADANLIHNQAQILKLNFNEKIQAISEETLVVYTRSQSASGDTVVNVDTSEDNAVQVLSDHEQPYKVLRVRIQHANPTEQRTEYDRMIRNKIQPDVIYSLQAQRSATGLVGPEK